MRPLLDKLAVFFFAVLLLFGAFSRTVDVKKTIAMENLTIYTADLSDGYTVTVPLKDGAVCFNRVSFTYEASAPVRAVFRYRLGGKTCEEELLLGSHETRATMLLDCYLKRTSASRLLSVRFEPIVPGQPCSLRVSDFTCDLQATPRGDVLYLENDRYKAGVKLDWGGGLCYFEDKQNDAYGNLLNCHDTGRLVQQSYYGPLDIDGYENGYYGDNGARWNYNPVQGGDQYGNTSKLVALEQSENRIRVVCRPLDWALNDRPTYTYYTNVYTLTPEGLQVENGVVDFLQAQWYPRDQEIPAFYTVSALGTFVFYDGDAPWTGDALRYERDLGFWPEHPAFVIKEGNDETWCAWTDDTGYGIGLYTPIAERLYAGRFNYDGSADANANSTNYVAPLGIFALQFDTPFTYVYTLVCGTVSEIRETFQRQHAELKG